MKPAVTNWLKPKAVLMGPECTYTFHMKRTDYPLKKFNLVRMAKELFTFECIWQNEILADCGREPGKRDFAQAAGSKTDTVDVSKTLYTCNFYVNKTKKPEMTPKKENVIWLHNIFMIIDLISAPLGSCLSEGQWTGNSLFWGTYPSKVISNSNFSPFSLLPLALSSL